MTDWMDLLCCPFCRSGLRFASAGTDKLNKHYGFLNCRCSRYPVISDVPVIKPFFVRENERALQGLLRVVESGRFDEVPLFLAAEVRGLNQPRVSGDLGASFVRNLVRSARNDVARRRKIKGLERSTQLLNESLLGYLDLFFHVPGVGRTTTFEYFAYRHSQPRHLVALSLLELIDAPSKPILELACGFGIITRSALHRSPIQPVIGIDTELYTLFVAARCVAPGAHFVCCDANFPLPFQESVFSTVACFDGLHYIRNKHGLLSEARRIVDPSNFRMIFGSTRNALFDYKYAGDPLTPEDCADLFRGFDYRIVSDSAIVRSYLSNLGPQLGRSDSLSSLESEPLFSAVFSNQPSVLTDQRAFLDWPHGRGPLGVNPLYVQQEAGADDAGVLRFNREFPSAFYESDNALCKDYLLDSIRVETSLVEEIRTGVRTSLVEDMIKSFLVIGLPEHYDRVADDAPSQIACATAAARQ